MAFEDIDLISLTCISSEMPVTERDFYRLFPDGHHSTGDIWMGLPSFGLVAAGQISGLVVTPACDLANCKTETVTYVPVVPVDAFLQMKEFKIELARFGAETFERLGFKRPRSLEELEDPSFLERLETYVAEKEKVDLHRKCLMATRYIQLSDPKTVFGKRNSEVLSEILGSQWKKIRERLVRNSYRSDIYYLPPDYQKADWSAIPTHSVALLRYLITVPTYFLDEANAADAIDWTKRRLQLIERRLHWCLDCHESMPPLRALRLKEAFLSDLLTKLVSIYVRIGAPDMDHTVLSRIEGDL